MSKLSNPYVFCEAAPKAALVSDSPRALIGLAIERLTELLHAQGGPWSSAEHRAIASLQAALFHLSPNHG
jgi:hypothetical protein